MNTFSCTQAIICAVLLGVCSLAAPEPMQAQTTSAGTANLARGVQSTRAFAWAWWRPR